MTKIKGTGSSSRIDRRVLLDRALVVLLAMGALFLGRNILGAAFSDSPALARESDRTEAGRETLPASAPDFRIGHPERWVVSAPGIVEPADRPVEVATEVSGRVAEIFVSEGQRLQAGDLLARLDTAVELALLEVAEADRDAARAELSRAQSGSVVREVTAAEAAVSRARAQAELSRSVAERTKKLVEAKGAAFEEFEREDRTAEADAAALELALAEFAAAEARLEESRSTARARLNAAEARVDEALAHLVRRELRAPIAGEILQVRVRSGEHADPADGAMIVMGDTSRLRARIDVDERDLSLVRLDQPVVVRVSALPEIDFPGRVVEVGRRMGRKNVRTDDPAERNDTKILEVVVELVPTDALIVGQRVDAYLLGDR